MSEDILTRLLNIQYDYKNPDRNKLVNELMTLAGDNKRQFSADMEERFRQIIIECVAYGTFVQACESAGIWLYEGPNPASYNGVKRTLTEILDKTLNQIFVARTEQAEKQ